MTSDNTVPRADQDQATYENDARARRVFLVDSAGNSLKVSQIEENKAGSDCSGVDGAVDRVLTLDNINESGAPVSVWIDGTLVTQTDMTITHKSASSTIEFAIAIHDADAIRVLYYV